MSVVRLEMQVHERVLIVRPPPDMTSCEQVRTLFQRCQEAIGSARRRAITLDLREVARADTKLIACLAAIHQMAGPACVRIETQASAAVSQMAELCRAPWLAPRPKSDQA